MRILAPFEHFYNSSRGWFGKLIKKLIHLYWLLKYAGRL